MKKYILIILAAALAFSCTEKTETSKAGKRVGEIYVTALPGAKTVLVNLEGLWRVRTEESWISLDVNGRDGAGAFTMYYASNESDFVTSNPSRRGAVIIESLKSMTADTLWLRQQGVPDGNEYSSAPQDSYVEFIDTELTSAKVRYANFTGTDESAMPAVKAWIDASGADVIAAIWTEDLAEALAAGYPGHSSSWGNLCIVTPTAAHEMEGGSLSPTALTVRMGDVNYVVSDFESEALGIATLDTYGRHLIETGYDQPGAGAKWLIGGSFYYYSAMETGYPGTPSWYPANPSDGAFLADRHMQEANLVDCVWMTLRDWTPTYTDGARSWRADYVYASGSLWNAATMVKVLDEPVSGTVHKAIEITVKY